MLREHMAILGLRCRDRVTGFTGVVESVSFDLYGCVQVILRPAGEDKDGRTRPGEWFDISRLEILEHTPVMAVPDFGLSEEHPALKGPAGKPGRPTLPDR